MVKKPYTRGKKRNKGRHMEKKKLILIISIAVGVLLLAAVAVGLMFGGKTEPKKNEALNVDPTAKTGVVEVVTKQQTIEALGSVATEVKNVQSSGLVNAKNKNNQQERRQTATYTFATEKTKDNAIKVDAIVYPDEAALEASDPFAGASSEVVGGVGDMARFYIPPDITQGGKHTVMLIATKGKVSYAFMLTQPKDFIAIEDEAAKAALTKLAQSANLDAVK